ncbi:copper resistance CopC family protein [Brachybacterium timonense]|uniref:copper resistance CopC family protein n=1 Tax=Brachybacterium timonense TaxID=2050896 RepID=UPI000D0AF17E|nr:copper resistance CopC family protein [Brachybacterium timonense]
MPTFTRYRAALLPVLAALAAAVLVLASLPAAHAHDTLISSDPADGAQLDSSPDAITLTYSADILDVTPVVRITDANGDSAQEITPSIDGPVATAELTEPLAAGEYTVQWRVVSSDGHPIEGTFTVTVTGTDAAAASDGGVDGPADAAPDGQDASDNGSDHPELQCGPDEAESSDGGADGGCAEPSEPAAQEQANDDAEKGSTLPLLLGGVAVVAVLAAGGAWFVTRRR